VYNIQRRGRGGVVSCVIDVQQYCNSAGNAGGRGQQKDDRLPQKCFEMKQYLERLKPTPPPAFVHRRRSTKLSVSSGTKRGAPHEHNSAFVIINSLGFVTSFGNHHPVAEYIYMKRYVYMYIYIYIYICMYIYTQAV